MKRLEILKWNIGILVLVAVASGCARQTIPNRIEQLKAERAAAIQVANDTEVAKIVTKHKPKHKKRNINKPLESPVDTPLVIKKVLRDNNKYYDADYANYVYKKQAQAFADTIAMLPNMKSKDIDYAEDFVGTTNFNLRRPQFVIIHHTSQDSTAETLRTFTLERTQVSAHYVIGRDGKVYHMVNDYLRAWQAGAGRWGNITDMNSCSIGIELDNNGYEPFSEKQINSLLTVLKQLKERFNIPPANFIGHADYAPARKNDPNVHFPWKVLAQKGYGLWWDDTTNIQVPKDFNEYLALRIIGYNVNKDIGKVIIAFRRHFCGIESTDKVLSPEERKILYKLYTKYL